MKKTSVRLLLAAIVAVFTLGSVAEAAPRSTVHRRAKHSSRVYSGTSKQSTKKAHASSRKHRRTTASASKTHKAKAHRPSTKPR